MNTEEARAAMDRAKADHAFSQRLFSIFEEFQYLKSENRFAISKPTRERLDRE